MREIDLSQLPAPDIVAPLDFEAVLAELKAQVLADLPELEGVIDLESEPVNKVLQVVAYQRVTMQARINDAARACMLAYANGADLDHLAALLDVQRLDGEDDARLRRRAQLALEGATVAGSTGSYQFHALGADARVKDAGIDSPAPGTVRVTVLSAEGDGTATTDLLAAVAAALSANDVRPLTDTVAVQAATVVPFEVRATLNVYPGPAAEPLLQAARQALAAYLAEHQRLGHDITRSGLFACLHQPGVQNVLLHSPAADLEIAPTQAAYCARTEVVLGVANV
ncbi:baseplate assembly protein [Streptomyces sp. G35A]